MTSSGSSLLEQAASRNEAPRKYFDEVVYIVSLFVKVKLARSLRKKGARHK
jgi:hypothetical protein